VTSDIQNYIKPRVPRAGKIRLGVKRKNDAGREYPADVDYFVLDPDLPGRDQIARIYGEKPKRLLVTFLNDDPREIMPLAYKSYRTGLGLFCRGDGHKAQRAALTRDGDREVIQRGPTGAPVTQERDCPCELLAANKCKAMGNLLVCLPEVGVEHYQIDTSSWHSHQNVRNDLRHFRELFPTEGGLRGRLFWLDRVPQETHGSGRKETHWPMRLSMPTPEEYSKKLQAIGGWVTQYRSLLHGLPAAEVETPAALPVGSPVEEPDLVTEQDQPSAREVMLQELREAKETDRERFISVLREMGIQQREVSTAPDSVLADLHERVFTRTS